MASRDIKDPKISSFLCENYEREKTLRTLWVNRNFEKIKQAAILHREPKNYTSDDITKNVMLAGIPTVIRDNVVAARNRVKLPVKNYLIGRTGEQKEIKIEPTMMPVSDKGKTLQTKGRKVYLEERHKLAPDEKFRFMECSNWAYGWQIGKTKLSVQGSTFGRKFNMKHSLSARVGAQPDPKHYTACDAEATFCKM